MDLLEEFEKKNPNSEWVKWLVGSYLLFIINYIYLNVYFSKDFKN
jgi:hypothetical protein